MKLILSFLIMLVSYLGYSEWRKHQIKEALSQQKIKIKKINSKYEREVNLIESRLKNGAVTSKEAKRLKHEARRKLIRKNQKILEKSLNKIVGEEINYKSDTSLKNK